MRAGRRRTAELEVVDSKGWSRFREAEKEKWEFYLKGPAFLREEEAKWPKMRLVAEKVAAVNALVVEVGEEEEEKGEEEERQEWWWEEVSKISGWTKKNWVMAAVKKAVARWKLLTTMRAGRRRTAELEVVDSKGWSRFREAEKETLKAIQQRAFGWDIRQMKKREMNGPDSTKELRKKLRKKASSLL